MAREPYRRDRLGRRTHPGTDRETLPCRVRASTCDGSDGPARARESPKRWGPGAPRRQTPLIWCGWMMNLGRLSGEYGLDRANAITGLGRWTVRQCYWLIAPSRKYGELGAMPWPTARVGHARCRAHRDHRPPERECYCGIDVWIPPVPHREAGGVLVVVRGWGKVLEYERGWRVERAELVALLADPSMPNDEEASLASIYGVEVWPIRTGLIEPPPVVSPGSIHKRSIALLVALVGPEVANRLRTAGEDPTANRT